MAKTYDTYKDSGIAWIGEIPGEWRVMRLGKIGTFSASGIDKKSNEKEKAIHIINYTDVYGNESHELHPKDYMLVTATEEKCNDHQVEEGDMIFTPSSETIEDIGLSAVVMQKLPNTAYSYHVLRYRSTNIDKNFKKYICNNHFVQNYFSSKATGSIRKTLCRQDFKDCVVLLPPFLEQQSISSFLDTKCGEIDSLISIQEEMISELLAYKQSVIAEAVTKGLDKKAKMKNSGVEWIGDIPEEWSFTKLKNIINYIESGVSVNAGLEEVSHKDIGVLKTSCVSKNKFLANECKKVFETELSRVACPVKANTIIVSRMNTPELVGACGYVDRDYNNIFLPDRLWQVHFLNTTFVKFVYYSLISKRTKSYFSSLSSGTSSSMQNISQPQFQNAVIALPPLPVQQAIATYLDEKTSQIDSLIALKQSKIESLKEYKKSIIYEYVTGKKRV